MRNKKTSISLGRTLFSFLRLKENDKEELKRLRRDISLEFQINTLQSRQSLD